MSYATDRGRITQWETDSHIKKSKASANDHITPHPNRHLLFYHKLQDMMQVDGEQFISWTLTRHLLLYNNGPEERGEKFKSENWLLYEGHYLNTSKGSPNLYNVNLVRVFVFSRQFIFSSFMYCVLN